MAEIYEQFEFRQIRTTRDTANSNFNGEVVWDWISGSNRNHLWDESYIMCDLAISENGSALTKTALDVALYGFSNNPFACLFQNGIYRINDKVVSKINDFPQTSTVIRESYSGWGENDKSLSGNPIHIPDKTESEDHRHTVDNTGAVVGVTLEQWRRISNLKSVGGLSGIQTIRLEMKLPFFLQKEIKALPPNCRHQLSLQVNPLWRRQLCDMTTKISGNGSLPAVNTVDLNVSNLILWAAQYESVPVSPESLFRTSYIDVFSSIRTISSNVEQWQMTVPRGTNKLLCCLYNNQQLDTVTPTSFGNSETEKLTRFRLSYDGQYFPNPDYIFSDAFLGGDVKRAYNDFIRNSQNLMDSAGSMMSYGQWLSNPIYCFRVHRAPGSQSNVVEIELNFSSLPVGTSFWLGAMYDKELEIKYNELLQPSETNIYEM